MEPVLCRRHRALFSTKLYCTDYGISCDVQDTPGYAVYFLRQNANYPMAMNHELANVLLAAS